MNASETPNSLPDPFYKCENPGCDQQRVWRPHDLRWSSGNAEHGSAAGFHCEGCYKENAHDGAWPSATTLATELARHRGPGSEWDGTANTVRLSVVGTLVCFPYGMTFVAALDAPLVGDDGESSTWQIDVGKEWADTEFLPDDLVRVEGHVGANDECDPFLDAERVELLREGLTGAERQELLACTDPEERWDRASQLARERFLADYAKKGAKIVYRGTTNDPERREQEHRKQGKDFDRLDFTSRRMTDEEAKAKEAENLAKYRKGHGGRNPQYNDDANG